MLKVLESFNYFCLGIVYKMFREDIKLLGFYICWFYGDMY